MRKWANWVSSRRAFQRKELANAEALKGKLKSSYIAGGNVMIQPLWETVWQFPKNFDRIMI